MISLIESGQTSATAVVLEKLAAGLGVALASLFEVERAAPGPLVRRSEQPRWRDPASGYVRRNVSPPDHPSPMRIVEVEFPAARRVVLEGATRDKVIQQQVWVLEGTMELTHGARRTGWKPETAWRRGSTGRSNTATRRACRRVTRP